MKWRPKFSLRTLLAVTAICGLFFGWIGSTWVRVNHQRRIVARFQALGCNISYDYQEDGNDQPPGWNPLRWVFGDDVDSFVTGITASDSSHKLTENDLAILHELPELQDVLLFDAQIRDQGVAQIARIRRLRDLLLSDVNISANGMAPLESCYHLVSFGLYETAVTDDLLEGIGKLATIENLSLGRIRVTATGVGHLRHLDHLKSLNAYEDLSIDDHWLANIAGLKNLEVLRLYSTGIRGEGIKYLKGLVKLRVLNLNGTPTTDLAMKYICEHTQLENLRLESTNVGDQGVALLTGLTKLNYLDLSDSKITDAAMTDIGKLGSLETLEIMATSVTDAGIAKLTGMKNLKLLRVGPNVSRQAAGELKKVLPQCAMTGYDPNGSQSFLIQ
jgi:internalin A